MFLNILCPTMGRNDNHTKLAQSYLQSTNGKSKLIFLVDQNDRYTELKHPQIEYVYTAEKGFVNILNTFWDKYPCEVLAWMGDDITIETPNFEDLIDPGYLTYGFDGVQNEKLATHPFIPYKWIKTFGFVGIPQSKHFYGDDFWTKLAKELNLLNYNSSLKTIHHHFSVGASYMDDTYKGSNNSDTYQQDKEIYEKYIASRGYIHFKNKLDNKAICFTSYNRPNYLRKMLASLPKHDFDLICYQEPQTATAELRNIFNQYKVKTTWNKEKLGVRKNPFELLNNSFKEYNKIVYLEDDIVLSPDVVKMAEWYFDNIQDTYCLNLIGGRCGWGVILNENNPNKLIKTNNFNSLGFALTKKQWDDNFKPFWFVDNNPPYVGWDWAILFANQNNKTMQPVMPRANHIGEIGGTHCTPDFHKSKFANIKLNKENIVAYYVETETVKKEPEKIVATNGNIGVITHGYGLIFVQEQKALEGVKNKRYKRLANYIDIRSSFTPDDTTIDPTLYSIYTPGVGSLNDTSGYGDNFGQFKKALPMVGLTFESKFKNQDICLVFMDNFLACMNQGYSQLKASLPENTKIVAYTMGETDLWLPEHVEQLNLIDLVITPTSWCKEVAKKSGLRVPIEVCPNILNPVFGYKKRELTNPFTFLMYNAGCTRKGFPDYIYSFAEKFGGNQNFKLILKTNPNADPNFAKNCHTILSTIGVYKSSNIEIINKTLTKDEMRELVYSSHCFVFPSRGEGFGLPPLEAVLSGMPAITQKVHSFKDTMNEGFQILHLTKKVTVPEFKAYGKDYKNVGNWFDFNQNELSNKMEWVYQNYELILDKMEAASKDIANRYSHETVAKKFKSILEKYELIKPSN